MSAHTPGPWSWWDSCSFRRLSAQHDGDVLHAVVQRSDGHPDIHFPNGGYMGPDARLIAAAPELLAALREALQSLEYVQDKHGEKITGGFKRLDDMDRARRAIAKATGEGP